jgi:hypothetical protein
MPVCTGLSLKLAYGLLQEKHNGSNITMYTHAKHKPQHSSQLTPASAAPSCFRLPRRLLPLLLLLVAAILLGVCVPCHMAPSRLRTSSSSSLSVVRSSTFLQTHSHKRVHGQNGYQHGVLDIKTKIKYFIDR